MAHCNTILSQILKFVPRHEFEFLANRHHSGRISLRDIVGSVRAQAHRLYHLGSAKLTRSNLSRMNESKPYSL